MTGENRANELAFGATLGSSAVKTSKLFFELTQSRDLNVTGSFFLTNARALPIQVPATLIDGLSSFSTQTFMCSDIDTTSMVSDIAGHSAAFARLFPPLALGLRGAARMLVGQARTDSDLLVFIFVNLFVTFCMLFHKHCRIVRL